MTEDKKLKKYILLISIGLFLLSLTQKCYCTVSNCSDSIMVFLLGWAAVISGAGITWLANPILFLAWLTLRKNLKASMFLSMTASLLSLAFLLFDSVLDNEAGNKNVITSYKAGYWLWAASAGVMLLGTFALMLRYNTRNNLMKGYTPSKPDENTYLH